MLEMLSMEHFVNRHSIKMSSIKTWLVNNSTDYSTQSIIYNLHMINVIFKLILSINFVVI